MTFRFFHFFESLHGEKKKKTSTFPLKSFEFHADANLTERIISIYMIYYHEEIYLYTFENNKIWTGKNVENARGFVN